MFSCKYTTLKLGSIITPLMRLATSAPTTTTGLFLKARGERPSHVLQAIASLISYIAYSGLVQKRSASLLKWTWHSFKDMATFLNAKTQTKQSIRNKWFYITYSNHWTYISTWAMGVSSLSWSSSLHTLIPMSSVVGDGSSLWNHGGLLKEQQVLLLPHPAPSHSGSPSLKIPDSDAPENRPWTPESQK